MTVTSILALGPSQPLSDCETQKEVTPPAEVDGVGAITDPTPPVAAAYHKRLVPVAVSGAAVEPWQ